MQIRTRHLTSISGKQVLRRSGLVVKGLGLAGSLQQVGAGVKSCTLFSCSELMVFEIRRVVSHTTLCVCMALVPSLWAVGGGLIRLQNGNVLEDSLSRHSRCFTSTGRCVNTQCTKQKQSSRSVDDVDTAVSLHNITHFSNLEA